MSLFYAVFYFFLASFFVGMLAIFANIMPENVPTYYGESGTIALNGLNPGLGFRPQVNVEMNLISFNPKVEEGDNGYKKYVHNLQNFLDSCMNISS